jgi:hypothetical protein
MKFVNHQTTLHLSFKIKCCVDRLRPPVLIGKRSVNSSPARFLFSAGVNAYFYVTHLAVPFLGFTISPELLGLRSIIHFLLFLICFYIGFIRTKSGVAPR